VEVFGSQLGLARRYADLLATTGIAHGLVGPREAGRLWERHLVNCAVMESLLAQEETVIDIGSGAGLPGLVLAVARPDLRVHLVEPLLRRTTWLQATIDDLGIDNVTVHRGRAEETDLTAPVVTARAVASLDKLVRWSFPLLASGGRLLALKGASAQEELDRAQPMLDRLGVTIAALRVVGEGRVSEPVTVVEIVRPEVLPDAVRSAVSSGKQQDAGKPKASTKGTGGSAKKGGRRSRATPGRGPKPRTR
jgi:16S rRNA (guanine527-N7)-methyltransferase